jgi:hypothetical protein
MPTDTQNNTDVAAVNSNEQVDLKSQSDSEGNSQTNAQPESKTISESNLDAAKSNEEKKGDEADKSKTEIKPEDKKPEDKKEVKDNKEEEIDSDYSKLTFKDPKNIDQDLLKEATEIFSKSKLSVEQAQKLVQLQEKFVEKSNATYYEQVDNWIKEAKKDPEFGGKDYEKNMAAVNKAFKTYGSDALGKFLDDYRFGDHPEVIRMFYRIGQTLTEDSKAGAGIGKKPSSDGKTLAERMYPNSPSSGQF